jgi:hypothetical protein
MPDIPLKRTEFVASAMLGLLLLAGGRSLNGPVYWGYSYFA